MILLDSSGHLSFFQHLLRFDHWLFAKINQQWTNPFFDSTIPFLSEAGIWIPLYLFLLVFAAINFGSKGWFWSFTLMMTAIISDLVSSHLIKHIIFRYRPCQGESIEGQVRILVNYCPRNSSFASSPACNHFAAAIFLYLSLKQTGNWWWLVFPWAFSIAYSQIYVGVHYPLDVAAGIFMGCGIGFTMSVFFRKQFGILCLKQ